MKAGVRQPRCNVRLCENTFREREERERERARVIVIERQREGV